MSRLICMLPVLALALALTATSAPAEQSTSVPADQTSQKTTPATPPVIKPGDRACLRETGSLIRAKPGQCLPVTGRSYSGDELRRTGTPDTARALQLLDPSISIGH